MGKKSNSEHRESLVSRQDSGFWQVTFRLLHYLVSKVRTLIKARGQADRGRADGHTILYGFNMDMVCKDLQCIMLLLISCVCVRDGIVQEKITHLKYFLGLWPPPFPQIRIIFHHSGLVLL